MPFFFQYLIKFSLSLAVLYTFYFVVLRPLTFYQWNRFYLLCYSLLSFVIPFINITPWIPAENIAIGSFIDKLPVVDKLTTQSLALKDGTKGIFYPLLSWDVVGLVFIVGALVMLSRVIYQYLSLRVIKRKAVLLRTGDLEFYDVNAPISPFSFANAIFINSRLHSEEEFHRILEHEFVHVKQSHTIDIVVAELLCIFNWFNPFAWLIRKSIRQNLEFIADHNVLQGGVDARQYQYLLLKVMGLPQYRIANHFSFSSLKKRIMMMNKMRTAKVHLVKFLFVLPLVSLILFAFRGKDTIPTRPVAPQQVTPKPAQVAPKPATTKAPAANSKAVKAPVAPTITPKNAAFKNAASKNAAKSNSPKPTVVIRYSKTGAAPDTTTPENVRLSLKSPDNGLPPLYMVDGVIFTAADMEAVDPNTISSIDVLKGASATSIYGDAGKDGVVTVTTKSQALKRKAVKQPMPVAEAKFTPAFKGLLIVDGEIAGSEELSGLDGNNIERIDVIKNNGKEPGIPEALKKVPGIEVDADGKVFANGKPVDKTIKEGIIFVTTKKKK